jgi:hypothetical protein
MRKFATVVLLSALSLPVVFAAAQEGQTPAASGSTASQTKTKKKRHHKKNKKQVQKNTQAQTK